MRAFEAEFICRVVLVLIVLATGAIGIPYRLRAERAGGPVSRQNDPAWFWVLMSLVAPLVALACITFIVYPRAMDFAAIPLRLWIRLSGAPVGFGGLVLFSWMFRHLGLNVTSTSVPRPNATLVTSGPYRWIRHPMYSAALILGAAATLLTANAVVLFGGVAMFALLAARSRLEEQRLVGKFGEAYRDYQKHTGRFLPKVRGMQSAGKGE